MLIGGAVKSEISVIRRYAELTRNDILVLII